MGSETSTGDTTAATKGSDSETSNGSMSSTGVQTTGGTDSSTSASSSASTSTTTTTSTTSDTEATSLGTTSSGTTTSGTTSGGTTSSGTTDSDSDSEGDCMGPGEEICDGVCVNTDKDSQNCGKCENVCEEGEYCLDAECTVTIPPYGAPMPEPVWV